MSPQTSPDSTDASKIPGASDSQDDSGPCSQGFWSGEFSSRSRILLMLGLSACFAIQTYLVYSDSTPQPQPLTGQALEGRRVWHQHNCQSCHQFYGFGGFLGPDLTNVGPRLTRTHLETMLGGSGAMPRFDLAKEEIDALETFLRAMNATGIGQARAGSGDDPGVTLTRVTASYLPDDADIRSGFEVAQRYACNACHIPFATSPAGIPDLTTAASRAGKDGVTEILKVGRGAMPAFQMKQESIDATFRYLEWLEKERSALKEAYDQQMPDSIDWSQVPWWEYR